MTRTNNQNKKLALDLWNKGVAEVNGETATNRVLSTNSIPVPTQIIAIGKAAAAMATGAWSHFGNDIPTLIVSKYEHTAELGNVTGHVNIIESGHPVPDENSLQAGRAVQQCVSALGKADSLLLLVSGGASALVEHLPTTHSLDDLVQLTEQMLAQDKTIAQINAARRELSLLKGGKLLAGFNGERADVIGISDVEGDSMFIIGSGIGALPEKHKPAFEYRAWMAANNVICRDAAANEAAKTSLPVIENGECLYGDINPLSKALAAKLIDGQPGIYIWGGEPTVVLPASPGEGGRNQALALLLAREISGHDNITIVVGGTDGTDGPTHAAGGIVDGSSYDASKGHDEALRDANSGAALDAINARLVTGPTGTNVMDLIIAIKS